KIAPFVNQSRRNPRKRESGELLDLGVSSPRARISRDGYIRLVGQAKFLQHGTPVVAVVPDGNKNESSLRVFLRHFQPATAFQFSLTIRAPRRPQMNYGEVGRLDRIKDLLLGRRFCANRTRRN